MIHFIAAHIWRILAGWFLLSVALLGVYAAIVAETPAEREARRRKERAEAARIHLRRVTAVYVARRQREQGLLITKQGDDVFNQVAKEFNLDWYGHDNQVEPLNQDPPRAA